MTVDVNSEALDVLDGGKDATGASDLTTRSCRFAENVADSADRQAVVNEAGGLPFQGVCLGTPYTVT